MYYWFMYVRPLVDGLYRNGTVHTSHEMYKQCFIPRSETTSGDRQTSLTDLSLAIGTAYESIHTFVSSNEKLNISQGSLDVKSEFHK